ncbi:TIGR03767 family metallophosphoesterase [Streptomyces sp. NPDC002055]|uniref:TIGR03767 family metallophosphoesterase n=1 Tax=Streptomyces sp. NPDC002055 TaxID=3154534 RepID=UPI003320222D
MAGTDSAPDAPDTLNARTASHALNRRHFLLTSGAAVAAVGPLAPLLPAPRSSPPPPAARPAAGTPATAPPVRRAAPYGVTTLETTARLPGVTGGGYRRLASGPGRPLVVRGELAAPGAGRKDRRTALACFVQFTDLHVVDVQSPLRTEFLRARNAGSWRPQEALSVAGAVSLVEQVNALDEGPHTGLPPAFVMTTGDNVDNNSSIELEWFLTVMNGGRITPNTGDPRSYEGVQNSGLPLYWHPEDRLRDQDKKLGLPHLPGFLDAAVRPVTSPGLRIPWYSTVGNHDDLPGGCWAPDDPALTEVATGARKLYRVPDADLAALATAVSTGDDPKAGVLKKILADYAPQARTVTPDPRRKPFTPHEYLAAHLDPRHTGPGPAGHGYTAGNLDGDHMYYAFPVAEGVLGISLDTTYRSGHYEGSLDTGQLRWLERTLTAHSSRHYDADGRAVRNPAADDTRILVFSHHNSPTMLRRPDAARSEEPRHDGAELIALLSRFPNVVAWINGHSHTNRITPHAHRTAHRSFWEVNTASHIDYPHHARVVELVDNHDGTLSLLTTLIESAAPHRTDLGDLSAVGLASLYRELSYNAPGVREGLAGTPADGNTELLVRYA